MQRIGIRFVLLDLDDTLITNNSASIDAMRATAHHFIARDNSDVSGQFIETWMSARNRFWSTQEHARRGRLDPIQARLDVLNEVVHSMSLHDLDVESLLRWYEMDKQNRMQIVPGADLFLKSLKDRGLPVALVTNGQSTVQRAKLLRFGLYPYFDAVVIEDEVGQGKPHAGPFLRALDLLAAKSAETVMIGDDVSADGHGAKAVGVKFLHVDGGRTCATCVRGGQGHVQTLDRAAAALSL